LNGILGIYLSLFGRKIQWRPLLQIKILSCCLILISKYFHYPVFQTLCYTCLSWESDIKSLPPLSINLSNRGIIVVIDDCRDWWLSWLMIVFLRTAKLCVNFLDLIERERLGNFKETLACLRMISWPIIDRWIHWWIEWVMDWLMDCLMDWLRDQVINWFVNQFGDSLIDELSKNLSE